MNGDDGDLAAAVHGDLTIRRAGRGTTFSVCESDDKEELVSIPSYGHTMETLQRGAGKHSNAIAPRPMLKWHM